MNTLYIVIPAYNEAENICRVINEWYPVVERYAGSGKSRLVVVDDGSKDETYSLMKECAQTRPLFLPVTKSNGGHGATVLFGYHYALEHGADYIFQTDADGQTVPSEFDVFWENKDRFDMVIGWRKFRQDGLSRLFVTKILRLVLHFCFGVWVIDANTPYRLLNARTLEKYIKLIPENFNLSNVVLSVIYAKYKCRIKYFPITFRPRQGGVNSINLKKIIRIGFKAIIDFVKINKNIRSRC